jgi:hypothetical protein
MPKFSKSVANSLANSLRDGGFGRLTTFAPLIFLPQPEPSLIALLTTATPTMLLG